MTFCPVVESKTQVAIETKSLSIFLSGKSCWIEIIYIGNSFLVTPQTRLTLIICILDTLNRYFGKQGIPR